MYNTGYMRRGGCPTCGGGNNSNFRSNHSPSYFNNRYTNTNTFKYESGPKEFKNSFTPYNDRQRIMTPTRNISNYNYNLNSNFSNINRNNFRNYLSPSPTKNTGCRSCSTGSPNNFNGNDYQRPSSGYNMNRSNNLYNSTNINYQNNNYNFRKRYDSFNDNNSNDNTEGSYNHNIYYSPLRNSPKSLKNSFSSENLRTSPNIDNNYSYNNTFGNNRSNSNNNNRYYDSNNYNNNNYNNNNYNNNNYNSPNYNNNNIRTISNNRYRNFLNDNINKYNYNNVNNSNNNNNSNNYNKAENRNYYSPPNNYRSTYSNNYTLTNSNTNNNYNYNRNYNNYNNSNSNNNNRTFYSHSRYNNNNNYLTTNQNAKNENLDRFLTLNLFNFPQKIRQLKQEGKTFFIHLYGSSDYTGHSWCSDCNIAKPNIEQAKNNIRNKEFEKEVYFLSIPVEKVQMDNFRDDPTIHLERVPTLIYYENGMERSRLIENDLFSYQTVNNFINQAYNTYNNRNMGGNRYLYQPRSYY